MMYAVNLMRSATAPLTMVAAVAANTAWKNQLVYSVKRDASGLGDRAMLPVPVQNERPHFELYDAT